MTRKSKREIEREWSDLDGGGEPDEVPMIPYKDTVTGDWYANNPRTKPDAKPHTTAEIDEAEPMIVIEADLGATS